MTKGYYFIFAFIYLSQPYFPQSYIKYYNVANEAEHQVQIGNYLEAKKILLSLKRKYIVLKPKECFYLGITNYFYQDSVQGFKNIELSLKGFLISKEIREFYFGKVSFNVISKYAAEKLDSIEKTTNERIDSAQYSSFGDSIVDFIEQDQKNRQDVNNINSEIDYKIQNEFLSFLKRRGIPDGYTYNSLYTVILLHIIDKQLFQEFKFFLFHKLKEGSLCPSIYAIFIDRMIYDKSKGSSTIYGSYLNVKNKSQNKINKNRKKIGLSTYCYFCNCNKLYKKPIIKQ